MNAGKELKGFWSRNYETNGSIGILENLCPTSDMMLTVTVAISKDHRELADYCKKTLNALDSDTATCWQNQFT